MDDREFRVLRERVAEAERLAKAVEDENEPGGGAFRGRWIYPAGVKIPYWQRLRINPDGSLPASDSEGELITAATLGDPDADTPLINVDPIIAWRYSGSASGYITMGGYPVCGACYPGARNLTATIQYLDLNKQSAAFSTTLVHTGTRPFRNRTARWTFADGWPSPIKVGGTPQMFTNQPAPGTGTQLFPRMTLSCDTGTIKIGFRGGAFGQGHGHFVFFEVDWPLVIDSCSPSFAARVSVSAPSHYAIYTTQFSGFYPWIGWLFESPNAQALVSHDSPSFNFPYNVGVPPFGILSFTITS